MEAISLRSLAAFCGATIAPETDVTITGIARDNRAVLPGDLFLAIRGEQFDGHNFVRGAARAGAVAALVEKPVRDCPIPQMQVPDTLIALGDIASGYRAMFSPRVVGVTGSVGKTTTKEMIASVLGIRFPTLKTEGNYNNNIGLPLTVLNLSREHEAAVFEMGTNHFGEISYLTGIAKPDLAVITTIGEAHLEYLGSKEGVLRAKCEILEGLSAGGTLICNGDDPYLWKVPESIAHPVVFCGVDNEEADFVGIPSKLTREECQFRVLGLSGVFIIHAGGLHNVKNALLAIAVGKHYGLTDAEVRDGLAAFSNVGERQNRVEVGSVTIISDCYNANPESMRAALRVLAMDECKGRRVAILGDMLELGEGGEAAHFEIGKLAAACADVLFGVGKFGETLCAGAIAGGMKQENAIAFQTVSELAFSVREFLRPGDAALLKASHGLHLEQVLELLRAE